MTSSDYELPVMTVGRWARTDCSRSTEKVSLQLSDDPHRADAGHRVRIEDDMDA